MRLMGKSLEWKPRDVSLNPSESSTLVATIKTRITLLSYSFWTPSTPIDQLVSHNLQILPIDVTKQVTNWKNIPLTLCPTKEVDLT